MAIPALGTGFLSYPVPTVARITLDCINNCSATSLQEVLVVIFTTEDDCYQVNVYSIATVDREKSEKLDSFYLIFCILQAKMLLMFLGFFLFSH